MRDVDLLNARFGIPDRVQFFRSSGDFPMVRIVSPLSSATISIYGAQVLSFIPIGQEDLLWMSPKSFYEAEKPIRGGILVCWPWFGAHPSDHSKPSHGFSRILFWHLRSVQALSSDETRIRMTLSEYDTTPDLFGFRFNAEIIFTIGKLLTVELRIENIDEREFQFTEALHSYFNISDVRHISLDGLDRTTYIDAVDQFSRKVQYGPIRFDEVVNRVYLHTSSDCLLRDELFSRVIHVQKSGSFSTVVWNPGELLSEIVADMEPDGYRRMVCIETANAAENGVTLAPLQVYTMTTTIGVE